MSWLGGGSKIRPIRILELGDIPEWLERESRVVQTEVPDNDDRILVGLIGTVCLFLRCRRVPRHRVNLPALGLDLYESL